MNHALSSHSNSLIPRCFDTKVGPGACLFSEGSAGKIVTNALYQKIYSFFGCPDSLCGELKIKPRDCTAATVFKPVAELFSWTISGYDTSDNSVQSQFNSFLARLRAHFHQKTVALQSELLSKVDQLHALFVGCMHSQNDPACKKTFEEQLEQIEQLSSHDESQTSDLSKLLSFYHPTDDKMLLHVLGDSFGSMTGLEGMHAFKAAEHLIYFFSNKRVLDPDNPKTISALETLTHTYEFSSRFYNGFFLNFCKASPYDYSSSNAPCFNPNQLSRIQETSSILRKELEKMDTEKPLYLFGGWQGSDGGLGHGMIYKFTKQKDSDLYSFEIINMGAGIDHHFNTYEEGARKIIPFVGKKNIPLDSLTSDSFVSAIYEIYNFYLSYDPADLSFRQWGPGQIYTVLNDAILKGDPYTEHITSSDWIEPQHSGTCAFRSLIEIFGKEMSPQERAKFETELGIWSLVNYISGLDLRYANISRLDFLSKSIHAYSAILSNHLKSYPNLLSHSELKEIRQNLEFIQKIARIFDLQFKNDSNLKANSLAVLPKVSPIKIPSSEIKFTDWETDTSKVRAKFKTLLSLDQISLKTLPSVLSDITQDLNVHLKSGQTDYTIQSIQVLINKIHPMDVSKLSLADKTSVLGSLYEISKILFLSSIENPRGYLIMPKKYLAMLKISDLMTSLISEEQLKELGFDSLSFLFMVFEKTVAPSFFFLDPKTLTEYNELKKSLAKKGYSFDHIPRLFDISRGGNVDFREESLFTLNKDYKLSDKKSAESFLSDVLLKSIARQLKKVNPQSQLWDITGAFLLEHHEKLIDLDSSNDLLSPLWKKLIQQALMMERFSTYCLVKDSSNLVEIAWVESLRVDLKVKKDFTLASEHAYPISMKDRSEKGYKFYEQDSRTNSHIYRSYSDQASLASLLFKQNSNLINENKASRNRNALDSMPLALSYMELNALEKNLPKHLLKAFYLTSEEFDSRDSSKLVNSYHSDGDELSQIVKYDKLRIDRAIAYFENPFKIGCQDEAYDRLFLTLILTSDSLLLDEFSREKDGPLLAKKLASFLRSNFDKAVMKENIKEAVFFSSMYRTIEKYYAIAQPSLESPFERIDPISKIAPLLKTSSTSDLDLSLSYGEFFLTKVELDVKDAKQASDLISHYLQYLSYFENYQNSLGRREVPDHELNLQYLNIQNALFELLPRLQNLIEQNPSLIPNAIKVLYKDSSPKDHWEVHPKMGFPYYVCEEKQLSLDLIKGALESSNGVLFTHSLPKKILSDELYKSIFKGQQFEAKKIGVSSYEFKDSVGNVYQVKMAFNSYVDAGIKFKKISKGKEFFLLSPDALKAYYQELKLPVPNLILFDQYRAWISPDKSILFVEPDSLKEVFYYNPKSDEGVVSLKTNDSLIEPTRTPLSFLSSFEKPYFINILGKRSKKSPENFNINLIEFPRLLFDNQEPLRFKSVGSILYCDNFKNLYLSEQKSPFYQKTDPILILEDGHKKPTLALMAPHYFGASTQTNPSAALKTSTPLDINENDPRKRFQLLEYDLIENPEFKTDKFSEPYLYLPRTREGALYLAFSYLRLHEYQKAFEVLKPLKSNIQKFNDLELKAAQSILQMDQFNKDKAPQAYSVKTLLSYILLNQQGEEALPGEIISEAKMNYQSYLSLKTYHDLLTLDPYEELLLIESLGKESSDLSSRYSYLSEIIDFSALDLDPSLSITTPKTYSFTASQQRIKSFLEFIHKKNLAEFKFALSPLTKDYYLSTSYLGPFLNLFLSTSSAHYSPSSVYFQEFFTTLYKIAKESAHSESTSFINLENYILFLKNVSVRGGEYQLEEVLKGFADFLWLVLKNPDQFPSCDEFNTWIFDYDSSKEASGKEDLLQKFINQLGSQVNHVLKTTGGIIQPAPMQQDPSAIPLPYSDALPKKDTLSAFETQPLALNNLNAIYEEELEDIIKTVCLSSSKDGITPYDKTAKQMQQILTKSLDDTYDQVAFDWIRKDCELYLGERRPQPHTFIPIISEAQILDAIIEDCSKLTSKQKELVASLEKEVLKLANKEDSDKTKNELKKLNKVANKEKALSIQDLAFLFQSQSSERYIKANPSLSSDEIEFLNTKIAAYLVEANFLQKLNRLTSYLGKERSNSSNDFSSSLQKATDMALAKRSYDITKNPSYLVYEHFADIQLYPKQVEKLNELKRAIESQSTPQEMGLIVEAIMGFGKSKVMLPLLALHISNLGRLPLMVMPDSLIESLGSEIRTTLQPMRKQINVIEINRGSKCSTEELQVLYVKLKLALENHETLIFSSKSLQVLFLKYIEFFSGMNAFDTIDAKAVHIFQEIFKILKQSAIPVFDEADLLFNCRHETHFSLNNPVPIVENHIQISTLLYNLILENANDIPYNFDYLDFNPQKESLTTSKYHHDLKPYLIEKLLKRLLSGDVFKILKINEWIESLEDKEVLVSYLMGVQNDEMDAFIEGIQNESIAHIIALAQAQLNLFIPLTINKKLLEHYGASKNNGRTYAIPYQHGKANDQSEFGNPYETINYTIQTYLQKGVPRKIIDKELKILSAELLELATQMPGVNLEEFEAYKRMLSIYPHFKGFRLTEALLQKAHDHINQNPLEKLRFIQNHILPQIKTYTQRISSNAQTFKMLFNKMIGFTGTMWNAETYPEGLSINPADGIIGNTLTQFIKKSKQEVQLVEREQDSFELLGDLIRHKNTKAWIDLSGHFDFMPRLEVVKKILKEKQSLGILGVVFYDENDELMVLHDIDEPPVPFALSPLKDSPENRFTLYDHQRITGADVTQSQKARAIVTVGKHLILRDLAQAAWRMRGLEKDQAVDFVTTSSDQQAILSLLNLPADHTLTVRDIIQYAILNQQHKKASDNLLSQKQKIVAVMQEHVFEMLTDQTRSPEEVFALFTKFKKLFVQDISDAPREQFGYPETLQETEKILKEFILHLKIIYAPLFGEDWNFIYEKMNEIIALEIMPHKMPARKPISTTALEQNIEVKLKQEVQSHVEREVEESYQVQKGQASCANSEITSWKKTVFEAFPLPLNLEELTELMEKDSLKYKPKKVIFHKKYKDWEADMDAILASHDGLRIRPYEHYSPEAKAFFSSNILIGNGLVTKNIWDRGKETVNGMCTERCKEALCFQTSQGLKMIMLDGSSALEWKEFIQLCDDQKIDATQMPSFLLNLQTGSVELPNSEPSFEKANQIIESREFKILKVQTKILSGEIYFKHDEIKLLEEWINENKINKEKLRQFILDNSIRYYPQQVTSFKTSSLHRLLTEEKTNSLKV